MRTRFSLLAAALALLASPAAEAHSHVSIGIGFGCCGYYPYYSPYYYGYPAYPAYVVPPPPAVYVPPPAPVVEYVEPQALPANQASPTFIDNVGRTCRRFETYLNGDAVSGKACLQPDGTWRTVAG